MFDSYLSDFLRNLEALCPRYFTDFLWFFPNRLLVELQHSEIMIIQNVIPCTNISEELLASIFSVADPYFGNEGTVLLKN